MVEDEVSGLVLPDPGEPRFCGPCGLRADIPSAYTTLTDVGERPDLRDMVGDLFRGRAQLAGWATAQEARRLILEAQRDCVSGPDRGVRSARAPVAPFVPGPGVG